MKKITYDFKSLESAVASFRASESKSDLPAIQRELNKFFKDSECIDILYTKNFDKLFFGICVYPILDNNDINQILTDDRNTVKINGYYLEFDSKLFDIGLTSAEITAFLLHEIGHLVNNQTPINTVREAIDKYMAEMKTEISLNDSYNTSEFLGFAIRDTIRKATSLFTKSNEEIMADEFVFLCGYGDELESGFKKVTNNMGELNKNVSNKFIVLSWALQIYKNMKFQRNIAIKNLNNCKRYTGSVLEKRELDNAADSLARVDLDAIRECTEYYDEIRVKTACLLESEAQKNGSFIGRIQRKGLKGLEEDVYEYKMRIRNIEEKDEAILLMRQLNSRMSVLDDYLTYSGDIPAKDRERWEATYDKYDELRDELSKKTVYNQKNYGLWFDYNQLDTNR